MNEQMRDAGMEEISSGVVEILKSHDLSTKEGFEASIIDTVDAITSSLSEVVDEHKKALFCKKMVLMLFHEQLLEAEKAYVKSVVNEGVQ